MGTGAKVSCFFQEVFYDVRCIGYHTPDKVVYRFPAVLCSQALSELKHYSPGFLHSPERW